MSSFCVVLPEQVDGTKYLTIGNDCCCLIAVSVCLEVPSHSVEVKMCPNDSPAGSPVPTDEEVQGSRSVQQTAPLQDGAEVLLGHVLVEKQQKPIILLFK